MDNDVSNALNKAKIKARLNEDFEYFQKDYGESPLLNIGVNEFINTEISSQKECDIMFHKLNLYIRKYQYEYGDDNKPFKYCGEFYNSIEGMYNLPHFHYKYNNYEDEKEELKNPDCMKYGMLTYENMFQESITNEILKEKTDVKKREKIEFFLQRINKEISFFKNQYQLNILQLQLQRMRDFNRYFQLKLKIVFLSSVLILIILIDYMLGFSVLSFFM